MLVIVHVVYKSTGAARCRLFPPLWWAPSRTAFTFKQKVLPLCSSVSKASTDFVGTLLVLTHTQEEPVFKLKSRIFIYICVKFCPSYILKFTISSCRDLYLVPIFFSFIGSFFFSIVFIYSSNFLRFDLDLF